MKRASSTAVAVLLLLMVDTSPAADPGYKMLKKIFMGGEGGWDYLTMDADARRLYITRFNRVTVLDPDSGKIVGEIAGTTGVHGVALVPQSNHGYSSNGGDASVTVFDLKTLKEIAKIKVGARPDAILYDPASDRVFTFNAGSKDATAIDVKTQKVAGTVKLEGKPESAVADEKGMVFVNMEDKNQVAAFDSRDLTVKSHWDLEGCEEPTGMAMDRANRRLFITCHNEKMAILDADNGKIIATPPIGKGTDFCVFDPATKLAFSSNGDGTLTVVAEETPDKFTVVANVKTEPGARTMALDSKTHSIYLCTAKQKPAPPGGGQRGRRAYEPGSFVVLVVGKE
jgi:YVTN family beta-propeller protein